MDETPSCDIHPEQGANIEEKLSVEVQQANDPELPSQCFICLETGTEVKELKHLSEKVWNTLKKSADIRQTLESDKYADATLRIIGSKDIQESVHQYHPACRKSYTAVKRPRDNTSEDAQNATKRQCIKNRSDSNLPKYDNEGLLKGICIFCGKARKKRGGKEEVRFKVATWAGCDTLKERAQYSTNERIKALVMSDIPLIAKEAEYHKTCRSKFLKETEIQQTTQSERSDEMPQSSQYFHHKKAFTSLCCYIQDEIIGNKQSYLVSWLLDLYKTEFISSGGDSEKILSYTAQNLKRKIEEHFGDQIKVNMADHRKGNFLYSSALTEDEAMACLKDDGKEQEQNEKIKWAALHLRKQILQLPKSKTPNFTNVQNLKECAPGIPQQLDLFFRTLLGTSTPSCCASQEIIDRKVTSMASDVIYNVSRGSVKPWKHTALGLGLASLTGSRISLDILNRAGHSISYSETKGLETEFAYSVESCNDDVPDGIQCSPGLATASVWDNNDANTETLDGKDTFHATVGHTYQNISSECLDSSSSSDFREGRNRRTFIGNERGIPAFRKSINKVTFSSDKVGNNATPASATETLELVHQKPLDLYWLWKLREGVIPLHSGFLSQFIKDPLPLQRICYMEPISSSPTNNDVVRETMVRTLNVAKQANQEYAVVTYDLAVAKKAYCIQEVERPLFDDLLILLGNFHVELAFYAAVGTLISESGIEFILSEADILAEGSVTGFLKGKFYNRCTRIHDLLANALEMKIFEQFLLTIPQEDADHFKEVMASVHTDPSLVEAHLEDPVVNQHLQMYEKHFNMIVDGAKGPMAQFWGIYVYMINRLHRELQRCVKTNDVKGYINVFPKILDIFFALNRPNYSRWGMLFLQKLQSANPILMEILEKGVFSIRRTKKNYSRCAIDLSLEQTVNKDAGSSTKGIVAFRNSDQALRRWALTMTQRALAVSEIKLFVGLEQGESTSSQCRQSRVSKDNQQMTVLNKTLDEFCNPFGEETITNLLNIATGRVASKETETYLLTTLKRGQHSRQQFKDQWDQCDKRFLQPVKKAPVKNFAAENAKKRPNTNASKRTQTNAENLRDVFVRMIVVLADNSAMDLRKLMSHPIIKYPLSLAHCDGSLVKTNKAALLKQLESVQTELITRLESPDEYVHVYDGNIVLIVQTTQSERSDEMPQSSQYFHHKKAFTSLCCYIQDEIIGNKQSYLVSWLLDLYKTEFISSGGDSEKILSYTAQNLKRKIEEHFGDQIKVNMADHRKGNFLYSSALTEDEAMACLKDDGKEQEQNEKIKWAALHLRKQILQLPKSKTPNFTNVQNLKECAPGIPQQLDLFFRTLLGTSTPSCCASQEIIDRKVTSMASDVIYNVSRGSVKPWKHTALGLGLASLTGSRISLDILNRAGHSISYSETKGLETEFAYSVESCNDDVPDGIQCSPGLATASVWDNNDANIETLDGKDTFHATVGHTYQNISSECLDSSSSSDFREGRNRRTFIGNERGIPAFRKSINKVTFSSDKVGNNATPASATETLELVHQKPLDLYWLWKLREGVIPLHSGFLSQFIKDPLPLQRICYMEPISSSPTNNDVVRETMVRTLNVAKQANQEYAVVTYDLAVAKKAYCIQEVERPLFDDLLILLGNFHVELAFYAAVGTLISESGIEFILSEADILAEGSVTGFLKGKFYNRCTRIHDLLANALEMKIFEQFLLTIPQEDADLFKEVMASVHTDPSLVEAHLEDPVVNQHLQMYEKHFNMIVDGAKGPMAQFWGIYVYMINRLHRELQRCVKTNDVKGYINVFPKILDIFFALNRPNYSRWGMLFLQKLQSANPILMEILEKGVFSIRRTKKNYSRCAIDLSLEQTVNKDAGSSTKGIVAFRNSDQALRRWALTMTQRALAVSEIKLFVGLEQGESTSSQCRQSRVSKDNQQMTVLNKTLDEFCNPFGEETITNLVNIATGRVASKETETYLLTTLKRGQHSRQQFKDQWDQCDKRFLQPVKKAPVKNFAAENAKKRPNTNASKRTQTNAENLRDVFVRMIVVLADNSAMDLRKLMSHPIIKYPLSLAHCDGSLVKTNKAALLKQLESVQTELITRLESPDEYVHVYDGGLLLHSILGQTHVGASYGSIAGTILSAVCSQRGKEIHVCLDKYVENSIKDSERKLRGAVNSTYSITGPEQTIRQSVKGLLENSVFKHELGKFLMREWEKDHYWFILGGKTLIVSFGGDCQQYVPDDCQQRIIVTKPVEYQGDHEEADTLISFHIANTTARRVCVRSSDTDVLIILIGFLGMQRPEVCATLNVIMDCGMGNSRRYINVSNIMANLEQTRPGLSKALPGYHAFTGCDFTSAFYRKGKVKPLQILEKDASSKFINLFISMGDRFGVVDADTVSEFVCRMYAQSKTRDVDEARYKKLIEMTGKIDQENPLTNVKKLDCALLPPCWKTLKMKIRRTQYVTMLWSDAKTASPMIGESPCDYGWSKDGNDILQPVWFEGPDLPHSLFHNTEHEMSTNDEENNQSDSEKEISDSDTDAWSEDSDSDEGEMNSF